MRDATGKSIGTQASDARMDGRVAKLQTKVKLPCVASRLFSSRPQFNALVVVNIVSIILLRSSG